jgi:chemotaxis protein MotB
MEYRLMIAVVAALMLSGCVSKGVHTQTVAELEQARNAAEAAKKQSAAEIDKLRAEYTRTAEDLAKAQQRMNELMEELGKVQQHASQEKARADTLSTHLSELDKENGTLRSLTADHEATAAKLTAMMEELARARQRVEELNAEHQSAIAKLMTAHKELDTTKHRVEELTGALATTTQEAARVTQDTEAANAELRKQQEALRDAEATLVKLRQEQQSLREQLQQEQSDKEREIQRLTQTQADLANSLKAEIAKGDIRIQQVADRLTINMVDRVLFDSGQGHVKPAGLKVLKQVSDILKTVTDKQIRIEGHTDNVRIRGKLKEKFPTNWELSTARATSVVRYLLDQGGVDPANISAVGYADMRPIANNETDEGRSANRRIEIVLYPKDLKQIVQSAITTTAASESQP